MTSPDHTTVVAALLEATATLPGEARRLFLQRACAGDTALQAEVESLLQALAAQSGPPGESTVKTDTTIRDDAALLTLRVPDVLASRYHVQRRLGAGGMAVVYLAHDAVLQRPVALKIQRPDTARSGGRARFDAEIRLTANLRHPNIVSLFDSGATDGLAFFVMPFIDGETLRDHLVRVGRMSVDAALRTITDVLAALQHAHDAGVVHRDVKPSNIMVESERALLADFGIAHVLDRERQPSGESAARAGTPAYMSPEQSTGATAIDGRSDIYSAACTLFEMLSGQRPTRATARRALSDASLDTWSVERDAMLAIAPRMHSVIERAVELNPADRYGSAAEFAAALQSARCDDAALVSQHSEASGAPPGVGSSSARAWVWPVVAFAALVGTIFVGLRVSGRHDTTTRETARPIAFDTTRMVVMPYEYDSSARARFTGPDRFRSAVTRWRGITVVDPATTRGTAPEVTFDTSSAAVITWSSKAGRYIRRRVSARGGQLMIRASLFDPALPRALAERSITVATTTSPTDSALQQLVDRLLLTGVPDSVQRDRWTGTASRSALVHFSRGMKAVEAWELADADSAFLLATTVDTTFARAAVWLSLVRLWQDTPPDQWSSFVIRARAHASTLTPRDASALAALALRAGGDSVQACAMWQRFASNDSVDFVSWFAAERCLLNDQAVVRDTRSPSGWQFRSSLAQGIRALERAFVLNPRIGNSFATPWSRSLPSQLLVSTDGMRQGVATAPSSGLFQAQVSWDAAGDSILVVPYRRGQRPVVSPTAHARGLAYLRTILLDLTTRNRVINSGYPIELLSALTLDAIGSPGAVSLARGSATMDGNAQFRLAAQVSLVRMLIKYSIPDSLPQLETARALADSLLRANPSPEPRIEAAFESMAVLLGRYDLAESYARRIGDDTVRHAGVAADLRRSSALRMPSKNRDAAGLRRELARLIADRMETRPDGMAPSAVIHETNLLFAIADTTAAMHLLAGRLESMRKMDIELLRSPIEIDALMRAIFTYAALLSRTGDRSNALRWSRTLSTLARDGHPPLQPGLRGLAVNPAQKAR